MATDRRWKRWIEREDRTIRRWNKRDKALAVYLGRSVSAVSKRRAILGLRRYRIDRAEKIDGFPMAYERWDTSEIHYLRANVNADMDILTWKLGRSRRAIAHRVRLLGLHRRRVHPLSLARRLIGERVWKARAQGAKNWQVAERLDINPAYAAMIFYREKKLRGDARER